MSDYLAQQAAKGRLEGLKALRGVLAKEIAAGPQGEKQTSQTAALARQLRDTLKEIAELEKALPKGSVVDDLSRKRASRRSTVTKNLGESEGSEGVVGAGGD